MNILENAIRSVSGSVDKAILCVKKPAKASVKGGSNMLKGQNNKRPIDLQAKLLSESKAGTFSFLKSKTEIVEEFGYHVLKVKYNPSKIRIDSRAGSFIQSGPGGAGTNTLTQITMPAQTRMNLELLFDEENHSDAFMFEKITNLTAGAVVSDVSGVVKNITGEGYTVRPLVEALIGMLTQSETRQVVFYWNQMAFAGEVTNVDAVYTMFNPIGNPIRATVSLMIQQGEHGSKREKSRENNYWNEAFDKIDSNTGSKVADKLDKVGNLLNFK